MTARTYPVDAVSGAPSYTGRALRQTLSVLVPGATSARPLGAQSGVRPGTPSTTVSVASSTYTVTPHSGVLDVETAAAAGPYLYAFDANVTGSVNAAHATYTRWDGIYVQLSDQNESDGTSGTPGVAIVYVAGTASASPAMPTQPARSLLLARIVVPNSGGGSSSVVWLAPTVLDGPPSYASLTDLQTRNPAAATNVGARAIVGTGATMARYISDGSVWRQADGVPIESVLSSTLTVIGTSFGSIGASLKQTLTSPGTSAIWKVELELDYQQGAASQVDILLAVNSVEVSTGGRMTMTALPTNFRFPARHSWTVTGVAAGSVAFDPQIKATVANSCAIYAGASHMFVTQVG